MTISAELGMAHSAITKMNGNGAVGHAKHFTL